MARIYRDFCQHCKKETNWVADDMSIGSIPDRCQMCGHTIWTMPRDRAIPDISSKEARERYDKALRALDAPSPASLYTAVFPLVPAILRAFADCEAIPPIDREAARVALAQIEACK